MCAISSRKCENRLAPLFIDPLSMSTLVPVFNRRCSIDAPFETVVENSDA
jgi:hypothetical protein